MSDPVLNAFLESQFKEGMALARSSDLFDLIPAGGRPPRHYVAHFHCKGLVRSVEGRVEEGNYFVVGISFESDYLRRVDPFRVLTWLGPPNAFFPNVKPPYLCAGRLTPGTTLVFLIHQLFEIITMNKMQYREDDALNMEACVWARNNSHRFPIDPRPLKLTVDLSRRRLRFKMNRSFHHVKLYELFSPWRSGEGRTHTQSRVDIHGRPISRDRTFEYQP